MRRVVVTGLGVLSPFGRGVDFNWQQLLAGKSGISYIKDIDLKDLSVKIAGQVPLGTEGNMFNPDSIMSVKDRRRIDNFILYGLSAATDAVEDSGFVPQSMEEKYKSGVAFGSGIGGLQTIYENAVKFQNEGARHVSPFFVPSCLINLVAGHISIKYEFKGPNLATTTACSTGNHAIIDAYRMIMEEDADVMLAGGSEAAVNVLALAGFANMRALTSDFNETPEKASRPWDKKRSGFVISEGAGAVVLEELEHAKARGAKIYAEMVGYGLTGDGHHITAPDGDGSYRAMKIATEKAKLHGVNLGDIAYVNAHGTSTPVGDIMEAEAVKKLFADHLSNVSMSSTKSATGHMLGAAGAVEAIFTIKAINEQTCPPTINLEEPDDAVKDLDLVPLKPKKKPIKAAMSNSFGFGGTNSSVVFAKYEG